MKGDMLLTPDSVLLCAGRLCRVVTVLDLETLVVMDESTGEREIVRVADCEPVPADDELAQVDTDIHEVTEDQWRVARRRMEAIKPLLGATVRTRDEVQEAARKNNVSVATLYRWIDRFGRTGTVTSLVPGKPDGGSGQKRISDEVEKIIQHFIQQRYLTKQKPSASVIIEDVREACYRAGLRAPHGNTIRRRLERVPGRIRAKQRGDKRGLEAHTPTPGQYDDARYPLDVYQIDHTPIDAEIVDDQYRKPIGRPWITVAIDCYSRMIAGFVVLLEPPSALSVGLAISHAVLPKDDWLAKRGIDYSWPVYGRPKVVHADNGSDFRCAAVTKGCQNNQIDIAWRPVKKAHYGGHIERLLGSVSNTLKVAPGTTFSNSKERGQYKSAEEATLTLNELEKWLSEKLLGRYHNHDHRGIETTPLRRFEEGIHGTAERPGRGLPPRPTDARRLLIDFLPFVYRTVQATGITIDNVRYYSPEIARWVGARDGSRKKQFRVHRDPRDISPVYFYDPEQKTYIDVPFANLSRPSISLAELRAARREAMKRGRSAVDEEAIFRAAENVRRIESEAAEKTRSARRSQQRRKSRKESLEASPTAAPVKTRPSGETPVEHVAAAPAQDLPVTTYEIEEIDD